MVLCLEANTYGRLKCTSTKKVSYASDSERMGQNFILSDWTTSVSVPGGSGTNKYLIVKLIKSIRVLGKLLFVVYLLYLIKK